MMSLSGTRDVHAGTIRTKGDANRTANVVPVKLGRVVGEVVRVVPAAGYVLVYFQQTLGVASLMMLMLTIVLAWSIFLPGEPRTHGTQPGRRPALVS